MAAQKVLDALHQSGIQYSILLHADYGEIRSPQDFAQLSNTPIEKVAKSLLLKGDDGYVIAVLPVTDKADMKAIGVFCGVSHLQVAPLEELPQITGFERFATTAIGLDMPVVIHESLVNLDRVYVATGEMGEELEIAPGDLIAITHAVVGNIAR